VATSFKHVDPSIVSNDRLLFAAYCRAPFPKGFLGSEWDVCLLGGIDAVRHLPECRSSFGSAGTERGTTTYTGDVAE
jgi:hypothetical protein